MINDKKKTAGVASVEFALLLPMLVLLALPIVDIGRGIQANMIITSISREGANLASRGATSLKGSSQQIMNSLGTAPPLDMNRNGMIYITKIMGHQEATSIRNIVLEQYRWVNQSGLSPSSKVWTCGGAGSSWASDGSCRSIPGPGPSAPTANVMTGKLADGEVIYLVETFYNFSALVGSMDLGRGITTPRMDSTLYAMTIF